MILPFLLLPATTVTLDVRATALAEALPLIGRACGTPMRAAPTIAEEIVLAHLDRASPSEINSRLANTFAAEWRTAPDGTLVLTPSEKKREADRQSWFALRRARVARRLAEIRKEVAAFPSFDTKTADALRRRAADEEDDPKANAENLPTPAKRLLLRLLGARRPEEFETSSPFGRVVFSLTPTELQRPLGPEAADALRDYREEAPLWDLLDPNPVGPGESARPAARLLLVVSRDPFFTRVTLTLFDALGADLRSATEIFDTIIPDGGERKLAPSIPFRLAPGLPQAPLNSLDHEPLAFEASDILLAAARAARRSVVVAPDDNLLHHELEPEGEYEGELGRWLGTASGGSASGHVAFDAPGWMTVRTEHPYIVRGIFFPRTRLRRAAQALARSSPPSLAAFLEYARLRPDWPSDVPGDFAIIRVTPKGISLPEITGFRLPAALSREEWTAAERGPIPLTALSPGAREIALETLYGEERSAYAGGEPTSAWDDEPTNSVPLARATLALPYRNAFGVEVHDPRGPNIIPAENFLGLLKLDQLPKSGDSPLGGLDLDRLRFFRRDEWNLTLGTAQVPFRILELADAPVLLDPNTYSRDRIPPALLRNLDPPR